jgi:hypothetical protein
MSDAADRPPAISMVQVLADRPYPGRSFWPEQNDRLWILPRKITSFRFSGGGFNFRLFFNNVYGIFSLSTKYKSEV